MSDSAPISMPRVPLRWRSALPCSPPRWSYVWRWCRSQGPRKTRSIACAESWREAAACSVRTFVRCPCAAVSCPRQIKCERAWKPHYKAAIWCARFLSFVLSLLGRSHSDRRSTSSMRRGWRIPRPACVRTRRRPSRTLPICAACLLLCVRVGCFRKRKELCVRCGDGELTSCGVGASAGAYTQH
jgi:hypothetical protein